MAVKTEKLNFFNDLKVHEQGNRKDTIDQFAWEKLECLRLNIEITSPSRFSE